MDKYNDRNQINTIEYPEIVELKWQKAKDICQSHKMPKPAKNLNPYRHIGYIAAGFVVVFAIAVFYTNITKQAEIIPKEKTISAESFEVGNSPELNENISDSALTFSENEATDALAKEEMEFQKNSPSINDEAFIDAGAEEYAEDTYNSEAYNTYEEITAEENLYEETESFNTIEERIAAFLNLEFNYNETESSPNDLLITITKSCLLGFADYDECNRILKEMYGNILSEDLCNIQYLFVTSDSSIIKWQCNANNKSCLLTDYSVEKLDDNRFHISISLTITDSDNNTINIDGSGSVQTDENGLINYSSLSRTFVNKIYSALE